MPKTMERALRKKAKQMGLVGERKNAFIFGIMRHKIGWKPKREKK